MRYVPLLLVAGLLASWGCSSLSVNTDFDPANDFSQYKTYMWYGGEMPADDALSANPLVKKRVASSVDDALAAKGYAVGTAEDMDFIVIIHAGVQQKTQVSQTYGYSGYGYGGYGYGGYHGGWGGYGGRTEVYQYDEATLVIDIVDAEKEELVWRGTASDMLADNPSREKQQAKIDKAVSRVMANFPPGTGK